MSESRDVRMMTTRLSPILIVDRVESTPYALRLTPQGKYDIDQIKDVLFINTITDYIISKEESKKGVIHFHAVLWTVLNEKDLRNEIGIFLKKYFLGAPKRGDANKQYNLKACIDLQKTVTYLLKDGGDVNYSSNINNVSINELKNLSYKKFSKDDFASELEVLKERFKQNDVVLSDMMIEVVRLKSLYRQPVNLNYIYQMCLSFDVHNKPSRASSYVHDFLSRYQ